MRERRTGGTSEERTSKRKASLAGFQSQYGQPLIRDLPVTPSQHETASIDADNVAANHTSDQASEDSAANLGVGASSNPPVTIPSDPTTTRGNRKVDSEHTDGCSSDVTTYFSAASSSPGTSPSRVPKKMPPVPPPKSLPKRPVPACIDFQNGKCLRQRCKYSHETELDRLLNLLRSSATRPQEQPEPREHTSNEKEKGKSLLLFVWFAKTIERLNATSQNTAALPKPPPEQRTLPVETAQVTFGPGFEVKEVQTGFESRKIFLKEIPGSVDEATIRDILSPFGAVQEIQMPEVRTKASSMTVRAAFALCTEAAHAVAALNGARVFGCDIVAQLATHKSTSLGKGIVRDGDASLEFPAPCITGYLGFSTEELADQAVQRIRGTVECNVRLFAVRYEGLPKAGKYNVKVLGLPPKTQIDDLARFGHDQGGMLAAAPNYESLKDALRELQYRLERFGELVVINVQEPPYIRQVVRVTAHFTTPDAAASACRALNGREARFCGNSKVSARHVRSVHYKLPPKVFAVIEPDILSLRARVWSERRYDDIVIFRRRENPDAPVNVKLLADALPSLTKLKHAFEEILRGEWVLENGEPLWDPFFNRSESDAFFQELEQRYDMLINKDNRRRMLTLFGSPEKRRAAREAIWMHVQYLRSQTVRKFSLEGRVIGLFMSADLMKLQQSLGHENVELDMAKRMLTVRGDEAAFIATEDILRKVRHRHVLERMKRGDECPVCFSEVTLPVTLPCGHTWCKSCLVNYCNAAVDTRVFPLKCLGNEARCSQCIPLHIARQVLSPAQLSTVARSAYLAYVHARPKEFYYCPTPDCPQIYRTAPPDTVLQCPSCLVRICGNCHVEYHEGSFCPDRDAADRNLFEKWTEGHDVKRCPGCKAPIERIAGCNHMTCTRCHTHLCWVCLATFSNSQDVYNHMHAMHGGIGI
ncbi:hypothetical protein EIP86_003476 [Pleurotus ostreatoroseus]|nr:hypothetical protein EIP86_003476 [Pleurotus ostreatoroseus]